MRADVKRDAGTQLGIYTPGGWEQEEWGQTGDLPAQWCFEVGAGAKADTKATFPALSFVLVPDPCSKGLEVLRNLSLKYSIILNDLIPPGYLN